MVLNRLDVLKITLSDDHFLKVVIRYKHGILYIPADENECFAFLAERGRLRICDVRL